MEKRPSNKQLFDRFIANKSNARELEMLFAYFEEAGQADLESLIKNGFDLENHAVDQVDMARLDAVHARLTDKIFAKPTSRVLKLIGSARFIRNAAAVAVILSAGLLLSRHLSNGTQVVPGSAKAYLSFNGKNDTLTAQKAGLLYQHGGVTVSTQSDGTVVFKAVNADSATAAKLNTIITPRGGEFKVTLSDGSMVLLNAGSKLTFPTGFRGPERKVYVEGEAFFSVTKNADKPFIVNVGGNEIKVLGTRFNVNSYPETGGVEATLLEGSVSFSNTEGENVLLKPNQQVFSAYGHLSLKDVSAADFNAWTKGEFLFNDVPVAVVMQRLARWYNLEVQPASMPSKNLYMRISRKADIKEVLEMIAKATDLEFDLKGNQIVLKKE
ncbi:FecR family protein [Pedobacter suwonensis]|uniref:FecR family protein n=1 Tax=Pedobacter suwonensis TaxID=332999 RepID=A0A1I0TRJ2_9SPHI|nr:FecR domain-containing protein [Pedobacter suwonensis]SFA54379.1 FecR family protein [Pedobacter suwonensis]